MNCILKLCGLTMCPPALVLSAGSCSSFSLVELPGGRQGTSAKLMPELLATSPKVATFLTSGNRL